MTLSTDSRFHLMSPVAGCQPTSGQLRAAAFHSSRPGQATNVWTNHSAICLKATLCFLDNGHRPKHTHSSFYDYKVSILFMVPSLFPHSHLCCVLFLLPPRCSALCLPRFTLLLQSFLTTVSFLAFLQCPHHSGFPLLSGPWSDFL